jgi:hypothetical protein
MARYRRGSVATISEHRSIILMENAVRRERNFAVPPGVKFGREQQSRKAAGPPRRMKDAEPLMGARMCNVLSSPTSRSHPTGITRAGISKARVRRGKELRLFGTLQAIQHRAVDMLVMVEEARSMALHSAMLGGETDPL